MDMEAAPVGGRSPVPNPTPGCCSVAASAQDAKPRMRPFGSLGDGPAPETASSASSSSTSRTLPKGPHREASSEATDVREGEARPAMPAPTPPLSCGDKAGPPGPCLRMTLGPALCVYRLADLYVPAWLGARGGPELWLATERVERCDRLAMARGSTECMADRDCCRSWAAW